MNDSVTHLITGWIRLFLFCIKLLIEQPNDSWTFLNESLKQVIQWLLNSIASSGILNESCETSVMNGTF